MINGRVAKCVAYLEVVGVGSVMGVVARLEEAISVSLTRGELNELLGMWPKSLGRLKRAHAPKSGILMVGTARNAPFRGVEPALRRVCVRDTVDCIYIHNYLFFQTFYVCMLFLLSDMFIINHFPFMAKPIY
jgi:hypothetical protein